MMNMEAAFNKVPYLQTIKMGASVQSISFLSFRKIPDDIFRHKRKAQPFSFLVQLSILTDAIHQMQDRKYPFDF